MNACLNIVLESTCSHKSAFCSCLNSITYKIHIPGHERTLMASCHVHCQCTASKLPGAYKCTVCRAELGQSLHGMSALQLHPSYNTNRAW